MTVMTPASRAALRAIPILREAGITSRVVRPETP